MEKNVLIQAVRIFDPHGPHDGQTVDVRIQAGTIAEVGKDLAPNDGEAIWNHPGACLSPGWVDGQAHFRDPGEEVKEGLEQGALAAQNGGFTDVALLPSTQPPLDHKAEVHYLLRRAESVGVGIHPIGALSAGLAGKSLAELHDLRKAGAVGFYDDGPVHHPELLRRALEYASDLGAAVWALPLEERMNPGAIMHEGVTSTQLGLAGAPAAVETMRLFRDLEIARYTEGRLHIPLVTTAAGVDMIRKAKSDGVQVTCATSAHHLVFIDEHLNGFNGTLRARMPFRSKADRDALRAGVLDGTIDGLVSDHRPEDLEHADVEFMLAPEGLAGIETVFAAACTALGGEDEAVAAIVRGLTAGPRAVLGLEQAHIQAGATARLTWFHPQAEAMELCISRGVNAPDYAALLGCPLHGAPLGVIRGGEAIKLRPADH